MRIKNRPWQVWIASLASLVLMSSVMFSTSLRSDNVFALALVGAATNSTNDNIEQCAVLAIQNIVFADLNIIQSIINLQDNNTTGALHQLSLAKDQLNKAESQMQC